MIQDSSHLRKFDSLPHEPIYPFQLKGLCPLCDSSEGFIVEGPYYRNTTKCLSCGSAPRHRAIFHEITRVLPDWTQKAIHECSPGWDMVSNRLATECTNYVASHYDMSKPSGSLVDTTMPCRVYQCEDIENQTFSDSMFDAIVMQDVFEHIFNPVKAIQEISRTLKTGGCLIMTVPLVRGYHPTRRRAYKDDSGRIVHLEEPEYHGNPIDSSGSLVTIDWGYDICNFMSVHAGLVGTIFSNASHPLGIIGSLSEVVVAFKQSNVSVLS